MRYVISYDLNSPGRDYKTLYDALDRVGAKRILYSDWIVRWNSTTAANIRTYAWQFMDANDRLMVTCLDSADWAGMNLMVDPSTV